MSPVAMRNDAKKVSRESVLSLSTADLRNDAGDADERARCDADDGGHDVCPDPEVAKEGEGEDRIPQNGNSDHRREPPPLPCGYREPRDDHGEDRDDES